MKRPIHKVWLFSAVAPASFFIPPAQAQIVNVAECVTIADNAERLACYDALAAGEQALAQVAPSAPAKRPDASVAAGPSQKPLAAPPAPQPLPPVTASARTPDPLTTPAGEYQTAEQEESKDAQKKAEPPRLISSLRRHQRLDTGEIAVELENGQVWRQVDSRRVRIKGGDALAVEIEESSFGGYWMTVDGAGAPFRVERVR